MQRRQFTPGQHINRFLVALFAFKEAGDYLPDAEGRQHTPEQVAEGIIAVSDGLWEIAKQSIPSRSTIRKEIESHLIPDVSGLVAALEATLISMLQKAQLFETYRNDSTEELYSFITGKQLPPLVSFASSSVAKPLDIKKPVEADSAVAATLEKKEEQLAKEVKEFERKAKEIEKLDAEIVYLQQSTRTRFRVFRRAHAYLSVKSRLYHRLHTYQYSSQVHVGILTAFTLASVMFVSQSLIVKPAKTLASDTVFTSRAQWEQADRSDGIDLDTNPDKVQLKAGSKEGKLSIVHDSLAASTFTELQWSQLLPEKGYISVRSRAADTTGALASAAWSQPVKDSPINLESLPSARYLEIEFTLTSADGTRTPVLNSAQLIYGLPIVKASRTVAWTGSGTTSNWSDKDNWEGRTLPSDNDSVIFDGTSQKNSVVDADFKGTIVGLALDEKYTGKLSLERSLHVRDAVILDGGTLAIGGNTLTVDGNWKKGSTNLITTDSTIEFAGNRPTTVTGETDFNNLVVSTPNKHLFFEKGHTQTVEGKLDIQGKAGELVQIRSTNAGVDKWKLKAKGEATMKLVHIGDTDNISGKDIKALPSNSYGNNAHIDTDPVWDGGGSTNNWSEATNWDTDVVPGSSDTVTFNATSTKNSTVDASFAGNIDVLNVDTGYSGTLTLARSLNVQGALTNKGIITGAGNNLTVGGTADNYGTLDAGGVASNEVQTITATAATGDATVTVPSTGATFTIHPGDSAATVQAAAEAANGIGAGNVSVTGSAPSGGGGDSIATKSSVLQKAGYGMAVATAPSGKIYLLGGNYQLNTDDANIYEYVPGTDTLTKKTTLLSYYTTAATASTAPNGKIYVFGGTGSPARIQEYDPVADSKATKTAVLPDARIYATSVTAPNGKIYIFGGYINTSSTYVNGILEYDPTADTITTKSAVLPAALSGQAAGVGANGKIYLLGGQGASGGTNQILEYDPTADTITTKSAVLPSARLAAYGVADASGNIYAFGGHDGTNYLTDIVKYDPTSDTVSTSSSVLPAASIRTAFTLGNNGKIYGFGGANSGGSRMTSIVEYAPGSGGATGTYNLTFQGALASTNVAQLTTSSTGWSTGTTTNGSAAVASTWDFTGLLYNRSGGTILAPSSLIVRGGFNNAATYTHNNGTLVLSPPQNNQTQQMTGSLSLYNLQISPQYNPAGANVTFNDSISVANDFTTSNVSTWGGSNYGGASGSIKITVAGNVNLDSSKANVGIPIRMTGTSKTVTAPGQLNAPLEIISGASISLTAAITFASAVSIESGASFATTSYAVIFGSTLTNNGTMSGTSGSWTSGNGSGNTVTNASGATMSAPASFTVMTSFTNSGTFTHNNGTVYLAPPNNNQTQTLTGTFTFYNLQLDHQYNPAGANFVFANSVNVANDLTSGSGGVWSLPHFSGASGSVKVIVAGNVNIDASKADMSAVLRMTGTSKTLTVSSGQLNSVLEIASGASVSLAGTSTLGAAVTVESTASFSTGSADVTFGGDITNNGTMSGTTGSWNTPDGNSFTLTNASGATMSAPATIYLHSNFTNGGTFNHNNGTLVLIPSSNNSSETITGSLTFYDLKLGSDQGSRSGGFTLANDINVAHNLTSRGDYANGAGFLTGSYKVIVAGNVSLNTDESSLQATLRMTGTGKTLALTTGGGGLDLSGAFEVAAGASVSLASNVNFTGTVTVESGATLATSTYAVSFGNNVTNNGTLSASSGSWGTASGNSYVITNASGATINAPATFTLSTNLTNNGTFNHNNGTLLLSPAGNNENQTITGTFTFYDVQIASHQGTRNGGFTIANDINIAHDLTSAGGYINGAGGLGGAHNLTVAGNVNLNWTQSQLGTDMTLKMTGTGKTLTATRSDYPSSPEMNAIFQVPAGASISLASDVNFSSPVTVASGGSLATGSYTVGFGNNLTNNGTLSATAGTWNSPSGNSYGWTNASGATMTAPATINLSTNFTNNGTFNHNNGTVVLSPAGNNENQTITGAFTFYNLKGASHQGTRSGGFTIANDINVANDFGSAGAYLNGVGGLNGAHKLIVAGNVNLNWTETQLDTSTTLRMTGSGKTLTTTRSDYSPDPEMNAIFEVASGASVSLASDSILTNTVTIESGAVFALAGYNLTLNQTFQNLGTLREQGAETITFNSPAAMDLDSGTFEYVGNGDGNATAYTIKDYGSTDYYNLRINGTDASDTFTSGAAKVMASGLIVSGGVYLPGSYTTTAAGYNQTGGTFTGSTGVPTFTGNFVQSGGTFTAPPTVNVAGNFTHSGGTFTPGTGTVVLNGTNQTLSGATTFYNLNKTVAAAATLTMTAGAGNTTTTTGRLTLLGASGQLLSIRSSSNGSQAYVDPQGTRSVNFVDAKDSRNINASPIAPPLWTDSGNNLNWSNASGAAFASITAPNGGQALPGGQSTNITWSASGADVTDTALFYSTNGGSSYPNSITRDGSTPGVQAWSVPSITTTTARVKVELRDIMGNVLTSDTSDSSFAIDSTAPGNPWQVTSTPLKYGTNSIDIFWLPALDTDLAGVKIYRSTSSGVKGSLYQTVASTSSSKTIALNYEDTAVTPGATYYYTLSSYDAAGNESSGAAQIAATAYTNTTPTVTTLGPTTVVNGSSGTSNTPTLNFTAGDADSPDTVRSEIQIDDSADFSSPVVDYTMSDQFPGSKSFTVGQAANIVQTQYITVVTGLNQNVPFKFKAMGTSDISAEFHSSDSNATLKSIIEAMPSYAGHTVTVGGPFTSVKDVFTEVTLPAGTWAFSFSGPGPVPQLQVLNGSLLVWTVRGGNASADYSYNGSTPRALGQTAAQIQTDLRATGGHYANVVVEGSSSSTAFTANYRLYFPRTEGNVPVGVATGTGSTTNASVLDGVLPFTTNVSTGTYTVGSQGQTLPDGTYYWRVKTTDISGVSSSFTTANSGAIAFKVDTTPPQALASTSLSETSTTATVSWPALTDADRDHVNIYRSTTSGVLGSLVGQSTSLSYVDSTVTTGVTYYYTAKSADAVGNESAGTTQRSITPTLVTASLTSPVGGEQWVTGSTHAITWTSTGTVATVSIYLSSNSGLTYPTLLASGLTNTHTYSWTLPGVVTAGERIKIEMRDGLGNILASDVSALDFATVAPPATPTPTPVATPTPTSTPTPTATVSRSATPTPTATAAVTPSPSATPVTTVSTPQSGVPSPTPTATPNPAATVEQVSNLQAFVSVSSIVVRYDPLPAGIKVKVYRVETAAGEKLDPEAIIAKGSVVAETKDAFFKDDGVKQGVTYRYAVLPYRESDNVAAKPSSTSGTVPLNYGVGVLISDGGEPSYDTPSLPVTMKPGDTRVIYSSVFNKLGDKVDGATMDWQLHTSGLAFVGDTTGRTVTVKAIKAGDYNGAIEAIAHLGAESGNVTMTVYVDPAGEIAQNIGITPGSVTLKPGQSISLAGSVVNQNGSAFDPEKNGYTIEWAAQAGTLTNDHGTAVYTAGTKTGTFEQAVKFTIRKGADVRFAYARVTISTEDPYLYYVTMTGPGTRVDPDKTVRFASYPYDQFGNLLTVANNAKYRTFSISDQDAGAIDSVGNFHTNKQGCYDWIIRSDMFYNGKAAYNRSTIAVTPAIVSTTPSTFWANVSWVTNPLSFTFLPGDQFSYQLKYTDSAGAVKAHAASNFILSTPAIGTITPQGYLQISPTAQPGIYANALTAQGIDLTTGEVKWSAKYSIAISSGIQVSVASAAGGSISQPGIKTFADVAPPTVSTIAALPTMMATGSVSLRPNSAGYTGVGFYDQYGLGWYGYRTGYYESTAPGSNILPAGLVETGAALGITKAAINYKAFTNYGQFEAPANRRGQIEIKVNATCSWLALCGNVAGPYDGSGASSSPTPTNPGVGGPVGICDPLTNVCTTFGGGEMPVVEPGSHTAEIIKYATDNGITTPLPFDFKVPDQSKGLLAGLRQGLSHLSPILDPLVSSPVAQVTTTAVGVLSGAAAALATPIANALANFSLSGFTGSGDLLRLLGLYRPRRRRKNWGKVLAKSTGLPVAGASVNLIKDGVYTPLYQTVSNVYGGFDLTIPKEGAYQIVITAPGYFSLTTDSQKFALNRPEKALEILLAEEKPVPDGLEVSIKKLARAKEVVTTIAVPFFTVGALLSLYAAIMHPGYTAYAILALYVIVLLGNAASRFTGSVSGPVMDLDSFRPVTDALVRVAQVDNDKLVIGTAFTDEAGHYHLKMGPGTYVLTVVKEGYVAYVGKPFVIKYAGVHPAPIKLESFIK